jgi:cytidylate kinase
VPDVPIGTGATHPAAASPRPRPITVAIDGPSGSGTSSVSREVALRLGLAYLDTGAMYRAVCWSCLRDGIDLTDEAAVGARARSLDLVMGTDPTTPFVLVDRYDVSREIRELGVTTAVSHVATNPEVRAELKVRQRALIMAARERTGGVVAEGRDITTVITPDAEVRILLTAQEESRLSRRALERHGRADAQTLDATRDEVLLRDALDATVSSFHDPAAGVLGLDSSQLDFEQTVEAVLAAVRDADVWSAMTSGPGFEDDGAEP